MHKKLRRQQVSDLPALQVTVQERKVYALLRRAEEQFVGGNGVGENILGLINAARIGEIALAADVPLTARSNCSWACSCLGRCFGSLLEEAAQA